MYEKIWVSLVAHHSTEEGDLEKEGQSNHTDSQSRQGVLSPLTQNLSTGSLGMEFPRGLQAEADAFETHAL